MYRGIVKRAGGRESFLWTDVSDELLEECLPDVSMEGIDAVYHTV